MATHTIRLAAAQCNPVTDRSDADPFGDSFSLPAAREQAHARIDEHAAVVQAAGEAGADLVVTGEDLAGIYTAATYLDDPSVFRHLTEDSAAYAREVFAALSRRYHMYVVACFFELEGDRIYNSAVLFGRDGEIVGRYHKVHLPGAETWQCTPGDSFPVFQTDLGKVGMLICYDQMWPESAAALALAGARIICHPSAASLPDYQMRTRSMDYQLYYLSGTRDGSRITQPNGDVLADAGDAAKTFITADVDVSQGTVGPEGYWDAIYSGIRDHRERHLKMRRPDLYGILVDPHPPALDDYPPGGLANTPETMHQAYLKQKDEYLRRRRGEPPHYTWQWWAGSPEQK
ncbi:MAG: carbon-nitrogen hydrolase family protein [Armatimonadota bacterium]